MKKYIILGLGLALGSASITCVAAAADRELSEGEQARLLLLNNANQIMSDILQNHRIEESQIEGLRTYADLLSGSGIVSADVIAILNGTLPQHIFPTLGVVSSLISQEDGLLKIRILGLHMEMHDELEESSTHGTQRWDFLNSFIGEITPLPHDRIEELLLEHTRAYEAKHPSAVHSETDGDDAGSEYAVAAAPVPSAHGGAGGGWAGMGGTPAAHDVVDPYLKAAAPAFVSVRDDEEVRRISDIQKALKELRVNLENTQGILAIPGIIEDPATALQMCEITDSMLHIIRTRVPDATLSMIIKAIQTYNTSAAPAPAYGGGDAAAWAPVAAAPPAYGGGGAAWPSANGYMAALPYPPTAPTTSPAAAGAPAYVAATALAPHTVYSSAGGYAPTGTGQMPTLAELLASTSISAPGAAEAAPAAAATPAPAPAPSTLAGEAARARLAAAQAAAASAAATLSTGHGVKRNG